MSHKYIREDTAKRRRESLFDFVRAELLLALPLAPRFPGDRRLRLTISLGARDAALIRMYPQPHSVEARGTSEQREMEERVRSPHIAYYTATFCTNTYTRLYRR